MKPSRMRGRLAIIVSTAAIVCGAAAPRVSAQENPAPIIEGVVGRSSFIDEVWDHFNTVGAGARVFVTPRLAIGPEVAYMRGESGAGDASNLSVTGNVTFDLRRDDRRQRFVPYVAAGGGYLRQRTLVGSGPGSTELRPYTTGEGTASGGLGVRIALAPRLFVAPEFRMGWEPEARFTVMVGVRPR